MFCFPSLSTRCSICLILYAPARKEKVQRFITHLVVRDYNERLIDGMSCLLHVAFTYITVLGWFRDGARGGGERVAGSDCSQIMRVAWRGVIEVHHPDNMTDEDV